MTGDLGVNRSGAGAPATGYLVLGNNTLYYFGMEGSRHFLSTPRLDVNSDVLTYRNGATTTGFVLLGQAGTHYIGFDGSVIVADGSRVHTDANTVGLPTGLVAPFRTAAEITAAGVRWTRETALDGRVIIGAGTAGGGTFVEATNYGTNWGVNLSGSTGVGSPAGGAVQAGGASSADPTGHTHGAGTLTVLLAPPSRAYVYGRFA
jgi:hypothetical protein